MVDFKSNCYGFVYAGLNNSNDEYFKSHDDLKLEKTILKWKIDEEIISTSDEIKDVFFQTNTKRSILELFDNDNRSQHVAFLDQEGNYYDQNWPDWPIRLNENLDDLLSAYNKQFWESSYKIYSIPKHQELKVDEFLKDLAS